MFLNSNFLLELHKKKLHIHLMCSFLSDFNYAPIQRCTVNVDARKYPLLSKHICFITYSSGKLDWKSAYLTQNTSKRLVRTRAVHHGPGERYCPAASQSNSYPQTQCSCSKDLFTTSDMKMEYRSQVVYRSVEEEEEHNSVIDKEPLAGLLYRHCMYIVSI